ncbi:NDP-sugar synthase [Myxococcota bacterium]|nr:NDP-sugar synthase [Myxococcota bacterium]
MRAMILAAGLGTRLRPLTELRAKPALPVVGRPIVGFLLHWLHHHGVNEVFINLHHRGDSIRQAVNAFCPPGLRVEYGHEAVPLGTGGGLYGARHFLQQSDPAIVIAGDMLVDADLDLLIRQHIERRSVCTLVLRRDPRAETFGSIGIDRLHRVRRIAQRFNLGHESDAGLFTGIRLVSPALFETCPPHPPETPFEDLSDWLAPALQSGHSDIHGEILEAADSVWMPVGTPAEYLAANFSPPHLDYLGSADPQAAGTRVQTEPTPLVLGRGASLGHGAHLERCVVWENEVVPAGFEGRGGVFAQGRFYALETPQVSQPPNRSDRT